MNTKLMVRPVVDLRDEHISELETANRELEASLRQANTELARVRRESQTALAALRKQLTPLYRALQSVFGELDAAQVDASESLAMSARTSAAMQQWKEKLGKGPAKAIDALLLHGSMTRKQLAIATGYTPQNITNIIVALNKASLITKDGDRVTLRSL